MKHEDKNELKEMCDKLGIPRMVADRANSLFKKFMERKSVKCGNNYYVSAACLLLACRQEEVPRTFKEICLVSKVSKKKIDRMLKLVLRTLKTDGRLVFKDDLDLDHKMASPPIFVKMRAPWETFFKKSGMLLFSKLTLTLERGKLPNLGIHMGCIYYCRL